MKKGFTLVELLVAMTCSIIVMSTIGGTIYFITSLTDRTIANSSTNYKITQLKDYILSDQTIIDSIKVEVDTSANKAIEEKRIKAEDSYSLYNVANWKINTESKELYYKTELLLSSVSLTSIYYEREVPQRVVGEKGAYIYYCNLVYKKSYGEETMRFIITTSPVITETK